MSARVTVRLPPQVAAWLDELGGDQAAAVRALMVLGAAQLDLCGVEREAWRLLAQGAGPVAAEALTALVSPGSQAADTRQPSGSQAAAKRQPTPPKPEPVLFDDPLAGVGIEV